MKQVQLFPLFIWSTWDTNKGACPRPESGLKSRPSGARALSHWAICIPSQGTALGSPGAKRSMWHPGAGLAGTVKCSKQQTVEKHQNLRERSQRTLRSWTRAMRSHKSDLIRFYRLWCRDWIKGRHWWKYGDQVYTTQQLLQSGNFCLPLV